MNSYRLITALLKWLISFTTAFWISVDTDIKILCVLAGVDAVLTLLNRKLSFIALCKRMSVMFILVGTVHFVYSLAKAETGLNVGFDISAMVAAFYCLGEAISILRNVDALGVPLPPVLLDLISKAEGLTGSDKREIVALQLKQNQETTALDLKITQSQGEDGKPVPTTATLTVVPPESK